MVGQHHRLNGHEFEQTLGVGDGQGGLACCSPWGLKESDMIAIEQQQTDGETMETVRDLFFSAPKSLQMVTAAMKLKDTCSLEEKL